MLFVKQVLIFCLYYGKICSWEDSFGTVRDRAKIIFMKGGFFMKRIISIFLCVAMLMSMVVTSVGAWEEDTASSISTENIVSYSLNQTTYAPGDEVLITVNMDEIWGDPDLVGTVPGYSFEAAGAYGMALFAPSLVFPTDVFNVTKTIRDYAGSSTIYGLGKDPNGDRWGNVISKTDVDTANESGFLCCLIESKDIYTYEYEDEDTGDYVEKKVFGFFQGSGVICQFRLNVSNSAVPGTYKLPIGAFQRASDANDSEWEFFGNYFKSNVFVDSSANAYGERPLSFVSATDEYVNDDPSQGAYITIVIEGEENSAATEVDALIAAIGTVTLDSEDAITAARTAYNALNATNKAAVKNLATLVAAEKALETLKLEAEAAEVDAKISAIGTVTLSSEGAITAARIAYNALSSGAKAYVKNLAVLEAAEKTLAELKDSESTEEDLKAAAGAVDAKIYAIGSVTIDSEDAITAARAAYDALDVRAKAYVKNLAKLEDAEVTFDRIKTAASITNENIVSYSLNQETYKAGDEVLITVKMDEIWGDPDLVGTIPGFSFEGPGAYGMAMLTPSIAFPTDVFNVTKTIRDYAGSSTIYGLGKDPNGDKWGNIISKTDTNDANTYGFLCALVESKDIYTYEYLDEETGEYVEKKIFGLFQGSGNVVQFRMNINADATPGTYKIPLGSFQRANGASDSEWEFFGNYFKANGFVDGAANAYGERPLSFVSATDEYVNDDPSQGAYITIVIEGEEIDVDNGVDALIVAIGKVTLDSEDAISAAREAYDALSDADKAAVKYLETLIAAEDKLIQLKKAFDTKHIHNVIDGVIAPVVPQNIKATTTDSTITVTWDAVDGAHKYWILVDGVVVAATSGNSCTIKRSEGEYDIAVRVALRARYGTSYVAGTSDAIKAKVEEVFKGYAFDIKYSADTKFTASWSYADAHIEKAWMLVTAESGTVYTFRVDNSTSLSYAKPYMFGDDYKVAMRVLVDGKIYHYDA